MLDYTENNLFSDNNKKAPKFYWERTDEELNFPKNRGDEYDDQEVNVTRNHLRSFSFFRLLTFDHPSAQILQKRMQLSSRIQHNSNPYNTYGYSSKYYHYFASFKAQIIAFSSSFHGFYSPEVQRGFLKCPFRTKKNLHPAFLTREQQIALLHLTFQSCP